jgi:type III secretion protein L
MTELALTDREPVLTAAAGKRIPRRAWAQVQEVSALVREAGRIRETAQQQAEVLRRRAYSEGRAAGISHAQAQAVRHVLDAQREARAFVHAGQERIVNLATGILARIAPTFDEGKMVAALAAESLKSIYEERHLRVRVSTEAEAATRSMLDQWQRAHPEVEVVQVTADPQLEPFSCVVESELGRIEVGLHAQIETIKDALVAAANATPETPG